MLVVSLDRKKSMSLTGGDIGVKKARVGKDLSLSFGIACHARAFTLSTKLKGHKIENVSMSLY